MDKISSDFYIKINQQNNVVEVIGRTCIQVPEEVLYMRCENGIKWYEDIYKQERRRKKDESCNYK